MALHYTDEAEALLSDADTGWLVFFSGTSPGAVITQYYTWSEDSHVALVIRPHEGDRLYQQLIDGPHPEAAKQLLLWEFTRQSGSDCLDFVTMRRRRNGARLVSLEERLRLNCDQRIVRVARMHFSCLRDCKTPLERHTQMNNILCDFMVAQRETRFDDGWLVLIRSSHSTHIIGQNDPNDARDEAMFCSEAVLRALQHCGLVHLLDNPRQCTPTDLDVSQHSRKAAAFIDIHYDPPIVLATSSESLVHGYWRYSTASSNDHCGCPCVLM